MKWVMLLMLPVFVLFTSCQKEGPEGPQGPAGPAGPQGPQGEEGNANVMSFSFDLNSTDWVDNGTSGDPGFFISQDLVVTELTEDILNTGLILVYFANFDDSWQQLPAFIVNSTFTQKFDYTATLGLISLKVQATDNLASNFNGEIRVVLATADIIEGLEGIDTSDMYAVLAALNR